MMFKGGDTKIWYLYLTAFTTASLCTEGGSDVELHGNSRASREPSRSASRSTLRHQRLVNVVLEYSLLNNPLLTNRSHVQQHDLSSSNPRDPYNSRADATLPLQTHRQLEHTPIPLARRTASHDVPAHRTSRRREMSSG